MSSGLSVRKSVSKGLRSLGLEIPIEEVEETITHPIVRARLVYAIKGGAVPRLTTDAPTDVDTFLEQVEGQELGQETQTD